MLIRKRAVLIAGAASVLLVGGGAAGAAIAGGPVDSSGVIHGCYFPPNKAGSSRVVLQDVGTTCPNAATAITWNQTGSQGPPGPSNVDYLRLQMSEDSSGNYTCNVLGAGGQDVSPTVLGIAGCVIEGLFGGGILPRAVTTVTPELTRSPALGGTSYPLAAAIPFGDGEVEVGFAAPGAQSGVYDIAIFQPSS